MIEVLTHKAKNSYDPSHTTVLRNTFAKNMVKRFNELVDVVIESVYVNNCFGLDTLQKNQMTPANTGEFTFMTDVEKMEAFLVWIQKQIDAGILEARSFQNIGQLYGTWFNQYINEAYKRGVQRARIDMISGGMTIPSIAESGGIEVIMGSMFHANTVAILYSKVYTELQTVLGDMTGKIAQIMADGMIEGIGSREMARRIVSVINGVDATTLGVTDKLGRFIPAARRAELIARTEMMYAFAEAQLQEFQSWGIYGVNTLAEWSTAKDNRVCEKCQPMEGKVFTIEEAHGMIPFHPMCRCIWLPYIEDIQKYR
jgi:SPP1 gp7 family putative phage head morphogenesis protein